MTLLK